MGREDPHFRLRLPADLKSRIEAAAKRNRRSINAEIVGVLDMEYPPRPTVDDLLVEIREATRLAKKGLSEDDAWKIESALLGLRTQLEVLGEETHPADEFG